MQQKKKVSNRYHRSLVTLLMSICVAWTSLNLIIPDQQKSALENRPLAQMPDLTLSGIQSGKDQQAIEEMASDQFIGRNLLFHLNYSWRKLIGQREIDNVYLADDALIQRPSDANQEMISQTANLIAQLEASSSVPVSVLVAPSAASIQSYKLPEYVTDNSENAVIDIINTQMQHPADPRDALKGRQNDYLYYRTDHHWTSLGAMIGAQSLLESMGISFNPEWFTPLPVANGFEGTLASKTGSYGLSDEINVYQNTQNTEYTVTWNGGTQTTSIYDLEALNQKDKYEVFLSKNQGLVQISTLANSQENLLLIKDSYANSMVQFLLPYFKNIYIVDPRYYYDNLNYVLTAGQITKIALVFSYNNFVSTTSLPDILKSTLEPEQAQEQQEQQEEQPVQE